MNAAAAAATPRRRLAAHWQQWWMARVPPSDSLLLTQRNVYILPTSAGWMLALTLLVLLVASINFQLNLGYLLTFLLAGCAAVSTWTSHTTLRGLQLHLPPPQPQFLGAHVLLQVQLQNDRRSPRRGIALALRGSGQWAWTDVPAEGSSSLDIGFEPARRGLQSVPPLGVQTLYPLGIFRVWAWWRPAAQVLIYPRPEPAGPPLPPANPRHRPGLEGGAIHQRGVQLVAAVMGEYRALAGVEMGVVLEHGDRRGHRVQGRFAGSQLFMALAQGLFQHHADRYFIGRGHLAADHARAAMDQQHAVAGRGGLQGGNGKGKQDSGAEMQFLHGDFRLSMGRRLGREWHSV